MVVFENLVFQRHKNLSKYTYGYLFLQKSENN